MPHFIEITVAPRIKGVCHCVTEIKGVCYCVTGIKGVCYHNLVWEADQWDYFPLRRDREEYYTITKREIHQEDLSILNIHASNTINLYSATWLMLVTSFCTHPAPCILAGNASDSTLSHPFIFSWLFLTLSYSV